MLSLKTDAATERRGRRQEEHILTVGVGSQQI